MKYAAPARGGILKGYWQFIKIRTARNYRLLKAVARGASCREDVVSMSRASNNPGVVRILLELGWDILCEFSWHAELDGLEGRYRLYCDLAKDQMCRRECLSHRGRLV